MTKSRTGLAIALLGLAVGGTAMTTAGVRPPQTAAPATSS